MPLGGVAIVALCIFAFSQIWPALRTASIAVDAPPLVYATRVSEQTTLQLPDGSRAIVAPESKLSYRVAPDGTRSVELSGQAFFTVTHNPRSSFIVRSGDVTVRVLGTAFDVKHYAGDRSVRVAVVDGKVASRSPLVRNGASMVLTPGDVSEITDSVVTTTMTRDLGALTSWTNGRLVFNNVPVADVFDAMRRWCGYEFHIADTAVVTQRVSTVLVVSKPSEAMRMLQELLDVTMTVDGKVVTVRQQRNARKDNALRLRDAGTFSTQREAGK
jgi:transmembrane sensor